MNNFPLKMVFFPLYFQSQKMGNIILCFSVSSSKALDSSVIDLNFPRWMSPVFVETSSKNLRLSEEDNLKGNSTVDPFSEKW